MKARADYDPRFRHNRGGDMNPHSLLANLAFLHIERRLKKAMLLVFGIANLVSGRKTDLRYSPTLFPTVVPNEREASR